MKSFNYIKFTGKQKKKSHLRKWKKIDLTPPSPYYKLKQTAKEGGIVFAISEAEFEKLVRKTCFLCNRESVDKVVTCIERQLGYVASNCKPICEWCAELKGNVDLRLFLNRVEHIAMLADKALEGIWHPEAFKRRVSKNQKCESLCQELCHFCGTSPALATEQLTYPYWTSTNAAIPACGTCRELRHGWEYTRFLRHCITITLWQQKLREIEEAFAPPRSESEGE